MYNPEEEALYLGGIIKRINNFDFTTRNGRENFQLTIYLLQAWGIDLGYRFQLYKNKPYSPELNNIGLIIQDKYEDITESEFKDFKVESRFNEFLEYIEPIKYDNRSLDLRASAHFLYTCKDVEPDQAIDLVIKNRDIKNPPEGIYRMLKYP